MQKIVVAVTGASGSVYAKVLLTKLLGLKERIEALSVIMTENAKEVWRTELDDESWKDMDVTFHSQQDFQAPFASGSGNYHTMIIVPCSMGTLGRIAHGVSNDLSRIVIFVGHDAVHRLDQIHLTPETSKRLR